MPGGREIDACMMGKPNRERDHAPAGWSRPGHDALALPGLRVVLACLHVWAKVHRVHPLPQLFQQIMVGQV